MSAERSDGDDGDRRPNRDRAVGSKRLLIAVTLDARDAAGGHSEIRRAASELDAARVDLLVLASAGSGLDPLIFAGWLATRTRHAGLVTTLTAIHNAPFHVARALSTLDFLSRGRGGWAPTTLGHAQEADAIGPQARIDDARATEKAVDFIDATCALWGSWDAEALIIDKAGGLYLDPEHVRRVRYRGRFFQVMGPLNAPRPPQGHPVLLLHDRDPLWRSMAARADAIIVAGAARPDLIARREEVARAGGKARILAAIDLADERSPVETADRLEDLLDAGVIDGVHVAALHRAKLAVTTPALVAELSRRGLLGPERTAGTLRSRLGLPDLVNFGPARRLSSEAEN